MAGLRIGIHTSRSGSLEKAAIRAKQLGANTFQIFSASPRTWRTVALSPDDVRLFRNARERFDLYPLAIHVSYLINLASLDPIIRTKSIEAFRGELERAVCIGAEFLVTHPGNHKSYSSEEGMAALVLGLRDAAEGLRLEHLTVLIENTVGAGAQMGGTFAELREIRALSKRLSGLPIGYCLDTCHLYASGFDIAKEQGLADTLDAAERVLGMRHVKLIHANDSRGVLGSRLDRHANIGKGHIGIEGFGRLLNHPKLRPKPFILETPDDEEGDHRRDIETLQRLSSQQARDKKTQQ